MVLALALALFLGAPPQAGPSFPVAGAAGAETPLFAAGLPVPAEMAFSPVSPVALRPGHGARAAADGTSTVPECASTSRTRQDAAARVTGDAHHSRLSALAERKPAPARPPGGGQTPHPRAFGLPLPALPPLCLASTAPLPDAPASFLPAPRGPVFFSLPPPSALLG